MIDDFVGAGGPRRKPKTIEPQQKESQTPLKQFVGEETGSETTGASPEILPAAETNDTEPAFVPPNQIAEQDARDFAEPDHTADTISATNTKPGSRFFSLTWPRSKKWTIVSAVFAVLLLGGAGALAFVNQPHAKDSTNKSIKPKYVPKDTRVPNTLTGMLVDPSVNQRPVTGIMIENSQEARPQSGLDQAGVVFEAIAEGGITRFLALFQDNAPDYLGPIRSVRPYYVQWCMGFDCALAHAGGSPEALQDIRSWGAKDLDQFANGAAYQRISGRYAPHNLYTSIAKLTTLESAKGYGAPTFTSFARKKESPAKAPNATSIQLAISSAAFNAHFDYDAKTNSYKRSEGGAPHMVVNNAGAQTQITPKVVVAIITPYGVASDKHSQYGVVGTGKAYIFQDGTVNEVTWSKADTAAPLRFSDAAGQDSKLNPGQTWITALSATNLVTYQ